MEYRIVKFDASQGQIAVKCQGVYFNVDLPIVNGLFPVGEELDSLIQGFIPVWHFERQALLAAGVSNAGAIQALVVEDTIPESAIPADMSAIQQQQDAIFNREIEQKVLSALVKHGVVSSDSTTIQSTTA